MHPKLALLLQNFYFDKVMNVETCDDFMIHAPVIASSSSMQCLHSLNQSAQILAGKGGNRKTNAANSPTSQEHRLH